MATTMDSTQVSLANNDEVEMMLVDSSNSDEDNAQEIKIDEDYEDDDIDDDDDLSDDDENDVASSSSSGRHTPISGIHHHHHGHHYGANEVPRVQQHHHHHFHYFYQCPVNGVTPNDIHHPDHHHHHYDSTVDRASGSSASPINDPNNAGLVRTISNGSMFGPINTTNLVPLLQPHNRFSHGQHSASHINDNNFGNGFNSTTSTHLAHVYNSLTPATHNNFAAPPVSPSTAEQMVSSHHYPAIHQQNPLVQQLQQRFRPKPPSPSVGSPNSPPILPVIIDGSQSPTSVQSSLQAVTPTSSTVQQMNVGISQLSQTVISSVNCITPVQPHPQSSSSPSSSSRANNMCSFDNINTSTQTQTQTQLNNVHQTNVKSSSQQVSTTQQTLVSTAPPTNNLPSIELPYTFGRCYQLTSQIEASNLYLCIDTSNQQEFCCKVVNSSKYSKFLGPHMRMDGHEGINQIQKVIFEQHFTFVLFERSFGDLHSYVRNKRRLRETEAQALFQQILQIVADCHHNGIVLRDLKLRKFIFSNEEKTKLKLETLEGASIFEGDNDILTDKHGCPAYVSPEILYSNSYSGMAADCWSMGVILYTMLVGRYPFHDLNPSIVFVKIRRGTYDIPETLSKQARCLIRNLIRLEPEHRLTADDGLAHRWFQEKWNLNTKERIIQQHITNLHNFQHQQFLFQHSLNDLTVGPPPRAILTPSLIESLIQLNDDQVVPTF